MRFNYRIVFIITALVFTLSTSLTVINYLTSMETTREQLKNSALPLTIDNIYTEIQKNIIEPNLIASMMAHDTFLIDWLSHEEDDEQQIVRYLETIQNKYQMFTAFLVSDKSKNYYSAKGVLDKVDINSPNSLWYFDFKKTAELSEINIDYNTHMGTELIMFINHKILNDDYHMIGATGIGLKTSYINDMLKVFRQRYQFSVYFVDDTGKVVIAEQNVKKLKQLSDIPELAKQLPDIIGKGSQVFDYTRAGEAYLLNRKYIAELDLYLIVEARVNYFTKTATETFYFNILLSAIITLLISLIIVLYVRKIHLKLDKLASNDHLTGLPNRRSFHEKLAQFLLLKERNNNNLSILFIDIDDFKFINDTRGHDVGDKVLKALATTLNTNVRKSDFVARWGGEEFIILLIDSDINQAQVIAEQLRSQVANSNQLSLLSQKPVTISLGATSVTGDEEIDAILKRVDGALYKAKSTGKNCTVSA
ncbi:sensor domain-containing diguanylate cyclase [Colwellia psychrerythraea]|uniref:diguanylate cyclase n=1 Tax=Colwellia psychrerythraea TaxID=28229 RepID=A0A099KM19_COLPS|nr:sensor domain-containing diguanylate cyclase [Colwellia psychrerythraea]KGJ90643.1 diguanylate cyclase [Colwellia psychrerythraea]